MDSTFFYKKVIDNFRAEMWEMCLWTLVSADLSENWFVNMRKMEVIEQVNKSAFAVFCI